MDTKAYTLEEVLDQNLNFKIDETGKIIPEHKIEKELNFEEMVKKCTANKVGIYLSTITDRDSGKENFLGWNCQLKKIDGSGRMYGDPYGKTQEEALKKAIEYAYTCESWYGERWFDN